MKEKRKREENAMKIFFKERAVIMSRELNGLLPHHNTSERVSPHYETASNCTEHLGSHRTSVHR